MKINIESGITHLLTPSDYAFSLEEIYLVIHRMFLAEYPYLIDFHTKQVPDLFEDGKNYQLFVRCFCPSDVDTKSLLKDFRDKLWNGSKGELKFRIEQFRRKSKESSSLSISTPGV